MESKQRNEFAQKHMKTVDIIVSVMAKRFGSNVEKEDIRSYALMGFVTAINRYDSNLGVSFSSYATPRIKGAIYDGLIKSSWLPRRLIREISFYKKAEEIVTFSSKIDPPANIAESTAQMADRLKELATTWVTVSAKPDEFFTLPIEEAENSEYIYGRKQYYEKISENILTLPPQNQILINKYFYENETLENIAKELGYSKSWASRVLKSSLKKIRDSFEDD